MPEYAGPRHCRGLDAKTCTASAVSSTAMSGAEKMPPFVRTWDPMITTGGYRGGDELRLSDPAIRPRRS